MTVQAWQKAVQELSKSETVFSFSKWLQWGKQMSPVFLQKTFGTVKDLQMKLENKGYSDGGEYAGFSKVEIITGNGS